MTIDTLVLIDDDEQVLASLRRLLRRGLQPGLRGVAIESYSDPVLALERLRERAVDLVICDYRMPGLDGITVLRRLARSHPDTVLMLLTGSPDMKAVLGAVNEAGVSRVMLKPWDPFELLAAVRACLLQRDERLAQRRLADAARGASGTLSARELELRSLEAKWPGITQVEWTEDGAVQCGDTGLLPFDSPPHPQG